MAEGTLVAVNGTGVKARTHGSGVWAPEVGDALAPLVVAALVVPGFLTAADVLAEPRFAAEFDVPAAVVPRTLLLRR
jgi:hypothetical protein